MDTRAARCGTLTNEIDPAGGMLRIAVTHNRPEILRLLLDFGFDPDERIRADGGDAVLLVGHAAVGLRIKR